MGEFQDQGKTVSKNKVEREAIRSTMYLIDKALFLLKSLVENIIIRRRGR